MRTPKFIIASLFLLPAVLTCIPFPVFLLHAIRSDKTNKYGRVLETNSGPLSVYGRRNAPGKRYNLRVEQRCLIPRLWRQLKSIRDRQRFTRRLRVLQGDSVYYTVTKHLTPDPTPTRLQFPGQHDGHPDSTGTHVTTTYQFQNSHLVRTSVVQCSKAIAAAASPPSPRPSTIWPRACFLRRAAFQDC